MFEVVEVDSMTPPKRLEKLVTQILLEVDPGEADRRAKAAADHRRVTVVSDQNGDKPSTPTSIRLPAPRSTPPLSMSRRC